MCRPTAHSLSHQIPFLAALKCRQCHSFHCFRHTLDVCNIHVTSALAVCHSRPDEWHDYHVDGREQQEQRRANFYDAQGKGQPPRSLDAMRAAVASIFHECRPLRPSSVKLGFYDTVDEVSSRSCRVSWANAALSRAPRQPTALTIRVPRARETAGISVPENGEENQNQHILTTTWTIGEASVPIQARTSRSRSHRGVSRSKSRTRASLTVCSLRLGPRSRKANSPLLRHAFRFLRAHHSLLPSRLHHPNQCLRPSGISIHLRSLCRRKSSRRSAILRRVSQLASSMLRNGRRDWRQTLHLCPPNDLDKHPVVNTLRTPFLSRNAAPLVPSRGRRRKRVHATYRHSH